MNKEIDIQPCKVSYVKQALIGFSDYKNNWFLMLLTIIYLVVLTYAFFSRFLYQIDLLGTIIGLAPLLPVLGLFHINFRKQWNDKLPKFLNATYEYEKTKRLEIRGIPLQGITDVRAQAQIISTIFLKPQQYFSIKPMLIKTSESKVMHDKSKRVNEGKPFMLYEVTMHLLQDVVSDDDIKDKKLLAEKVLIHRDKLFKNKQAYLRLDPNFDLEKDLKIIDVKVKAESAEKLMN